jgi:ribosomal-protein-alanine N-acetyltransferase
MSNHNTLYLAREATIDDIKAIKNLNERSLAENYPKSVYETQLKSFPHASFVIVNKANNSVVAYILCIIKSSLENDKEKNGRIGQDQNQESIEKSAQNDTKNGIEKNTEQNTQTNAHINSIAVMSKHRRRGLGTHLLKEAEKSLIENYNIKSLSLNVRVTNEQAQSLYTKEGFKIIDTVKGYYFGTVDSYTMRKDY